MSAGFTLSNRTHNVTTPSSRHPTSTSTPHSQKNALTPLAKQLIAAQDAYNTLQSTAAKSQMKYELSTQPGVVGRRVRIDGGKDEEKAITTATRTTSSTNKDTSSSVTAASALLSSKEQYDLKRRELSSLTLDLIMTLNMSQITLLRTAWDDHGGEVNIAQFVEIMLRYLNVKKLNTSPEMLIRSLVELFASMDLDGDGALEFEELLTTVVHMGLAATEHLLLTPISSYHPDSQYLLSMDQIDRTIFYIPTRNTLCIYDSNLKGYGFRMFDPLMKYSLAVEIPGLNSVLAMAYVSGASVLEQGRTSSSAFGVAGGGGGLGRASAAAARASAMDSTSADYLAHHSVSGGGDDDSPTSASQSLFDRLSSMPLTRPMRMENGQPVIMQQQNTRNGNRGNNNNNKKKKTESTSAAAVNNIYSEYIAKPYYGMNTNLHSFTTQTTNNGNSSGNGSSSSSSSSNNTSSSSSTSTSSTTNASSTTTTRTPLIFLQDDFLITSTSQHLSLWAGFPTGPVTLCDTHKIKNSYSCLKWCKETQTIYAGDVKGGIEGWKIVLPSGSNSASSNPSSSSSNNTSSTSTTSFASYKHARLLKDRDYLGHSDMITGLESMSSMRYLLSSSLDTTVRMFDLQTGCEKTLFTGHRAGVIALAYSNEFRFFLSAGSDHIVCVWSPFAEQQVDTLRGHNSPLIGVQFVTGTPQIVSADTEGSIRIWDARNFTCCQVFSTIPQLTSFTVCSSGLSAGSYRIFVVGQIHEVYVYQQEGGQGREGGGGGGGGGEAAASSTALTRHSNNNTNNSRSSTTPKHSDILSCNYSSLTMTFLTSTRHDVKIYDGLTGSLSRIYRGLAEACDITAVCLDARQRKLFAGDVEGRVRCYNYLTGAYMKSLTSHTKGEEIIQIQYCAQRRLLITGTDRTIYIHDERPIDEQILIMSTSSPPNTEYLHFTLSDRLMSMSCAISNGKVEVWNLDEGMRDVPLSSGNNGTDLHLDVISGMLYIDSHALLITTDDSACIKAWFVRPSKWKGQLAFELQTPGKKKDVNGTTAVVPPTIVRKKSSIKRTSSLLSSSPPLPLNNPDPILSIARHSIPGISSLAYDAATHSLFCGHRDGEILVWNLEALLRRIEEAGEDESVSWFEGEVGGVTQQQQKTGTGMKTPTMSPTSAGITTTATTPSSSNLMKQEAISSLKTGTRSIASTPSSSLQKMKRQGSMSLADRVLELQRSKSSLVPSSSSSSIISAPVSLSLKDELSRMSRELTPAYSISAYDTVVSTLRVVTDPPALISTSTSPVATIWSFSGVKLGELDPQEGLERAYAASAGIISKSYPGQKKWNFHINVKTREVEDRIMTLGVLKELEQLTRSQQQQQQQLQQQIQASSSASTPLLTSNSSIPLLPLADAATRVRSVGKSDERKEQHGSMLANAIPKSTITKVRT